MEIKNVPFSILILNCCIESFDDHCVDLLLYTFSLQNPFDGEEFNFRFPFLFSLLLYLSGNQNNHPSSSFYTHLAEWVSLDQEGELCLLIK